MNSNMFIFYINMNEHKCLRKYSRHIHQLSRTICITLYIKHNSNIYIYIYIYVCIYIYNKYINI